jgi:hypothetical protein
MRGVACLCQTYWCRRDEIDEYFTQAENTFQFVTSSIRMLLVKPGYFPLREEKWEAHQAG